MKVTKLILIIAVIGIIIVPLMCNVKSCNKPAPHIDSTLIKLNQYVDSLEHILTIQDSVILRRDTIILNQRFFIPIAARNTYNLSNDSSVALFNSWSSLFEDSVYRNNYFGTQ